MARAIVHMAAVLLPALLATGCGGGGADAVAGAASGTAGVVSGGGAATASAATTTGTGAVTVTASTAAMPAGAVRLAGGGWVAATTIDEFAAGASIRLQRYDASGTPVGAATVANTLPGSAGLAHVVALAGGGFAVTWMGQDGSLATEYGYTLPLLYTYSRTYDAAGQALGAPVQLSTTASYSYTLDVPTALAGGGYVVLWSVDTSYPSIPGYRVPPVSQRVVGADGVPVNAPTLVFDTYAAPAAPVFQVTPDAAGGFRVDWQRSTPGGTTAGSRSYDASGAALTP